MKNKLRINGTAKITGSHHGVLPIIVRGAMLIGETNITTGFTPKAYPDKSSEKIYTRGNGDVNVW